MNNLEYVKQKITFFGSVDSDSIEKVAKLYFIGLGFDAYISSGQTAITSILSKYTTKKFKQLGEVLHDKQKGLPDLVIIKNDEIAFVEVKSYHDKHSDSLSQHQLLWISEHPEYKVIVLGLQINFENSKDIYIKKLEDENRELKENIMQDKLANIDFGEKQDRFRWSIYNELIDFSEKIKRRELKVDLEDRENQKR
jgi:hypothetical protein